MLSRSGFVVALSWARRQVETLDGVLELQGDDAVQSAGMVCSSLHQSSDNCSGTGPGQARKDTTAYSTQTASFSPTWVFERETMECGGEPRNRGQILAAPKDPPGFLYALFSSRERQSRSQAADRRLFRQSRRWETLCGLDCAHLHTSALCRSKEGKVATMQDFQS
jgi:hypothetical protein